MKKNFKGIKMKITEKEKRNIDKGLQQCFGNAQVVTDAARQKRLDPDCTGESCPSPPGLWGLGKAPLLEILLNKGVHSKQSSDASLTTMVRFQSHTHEAQPGNHP